VLLVCIHAGFSFVALMHAWCLRWSFCCHIFQSLHCMSMAEGIDYCVHDNSFEAFLFFSHFSTAVSCQQSPHCYNNYNNQLINYHNNQRSIQLSHSCQGVIFAATFRCAIAKCQTVPAAQTIIDSLWSSI